MRNFLAATAMCLPLLAPQSARAEDKGTFANPSTTFEKLPGAFSASNVTLACTPGTFLPLGMHASFQDITDPKSDAFDEDVQWKFGPDGKFGANISQVEGTPLTRLEAFNRFKSTLVELWLISSQVCQQFGAALPKSTPKEEPLPPTSSPIPATPTSYDHVGRRDPFYGARLALQ